MLLIYLATIKRYKRSWIRNIPHSYCFLRVYIKCTSKHKVNSYCLYVFMVLICQTNGAYKFRWINLTTSFYWLFAIQIHPAKKKWTFNITWLLWAINMLTHVFLLFSGFVYMWQYHSHIHKWSTIPLIFIFHSKSHIEQRNIPPPVHCILFFSRSVTFRRIAHRNLFWVILQYLYQHGTFKWRNTIGPRAHAP